MTSFAGLSSLLERGQEVIVIDVAGRSMRGRVASISSSELVLVGFRPRQERTFTEASVRTIQIVDPKRNGAAIGLGVAGGVIAAMAMVDARLPEGTSLKGLRTMMAAVGLTPMMVLAGAAVDGSTNAPIYQRLSRAPRVTVGPQLGHDRVAIAAHVSF